MPLWALPRKNRSERCQAFDPVFLLVGFLSFFLAGGFTSKYLKGARLSLQVGVPVSTSFLPGTKNDRTFCLELSLAQIQDYGSQESGVPKAFL